MNDNDATKSERPRFPSTHWTEVRRAGCSAEESGIAALGALLSRYRPALEAYARQRFASAENDVADWFQGFIEGPILRRGLILRAQPAEGRQFRSYLLSAWHTFILEQHRHSSTRKRRPSGGLVPLPDSPEDYPEGLAAPIPEPFDIAWAREVLSEAVDRMKAVCQAEGRNDIWGVFEERILNPIVRGTNAMPYGTLVDLFQIESPTQARNLLVTGKRMLRRCLTQVVGQYAKGDEAIMNELRELKAILESTS